MLPSLGFSEILLLGILALVVVGPKDLPLMLRKLGRWTAKLRGMAQEFRSGFDDLARQAELDELKKEVDALRRTTAFTDIRNEFNKPLGTIEDYAGVKKPPQIEAPASPSMGEAARSAGGGADAALEDESPEAPSELASASPPQSPLRGDSSPIEGEPAQIPEPAVRSAQ